MCSIGKMVDSYHHLEHGTVWFNEKYSTSGI